MNKLFDFIKTLVVGKFYGELRIKFFGGEIRHIEKYESLDVNTFQNIPQPNK